MPAIRVVEMLQDVFGQKTDWHCMSMFEAAKLMTFFSGKNISIMSSAENLTQSVKR